MSFRALLVERDDDRVTTSIRRLTVDDLMPGEVTIRVAYSSVNFKDALCIRPDGRVARRYPLVPGVDLSGTVVDSTDPAFVSGQRVIAHGYDVGVAHHGGYAELARLPAGWLVPLPPRLSLRDAMAIGSAGFTAALCVERLEAHGIAPESGPILVTAASGGVGSTSVALLAKRGFHVVASTRGGHGDAVLRRLGARTVMSHADVSASSEKRLEKETWAGAVDSVGGAALAYVLRTLRYGGVVAVCGNVGGGDVETSVFPFILRAVTAVGIDVVRVPIPDRRRVWARLADPDDLQVPFLDELTTEIGLDQLPEHLAAVSRGDGRGRTVVRLGGEGPEG